MNTQSVSAKTDIVGFQGHLKEYHLYQIYSNVFFHRLQDVIDKKYIIFASKNADDEKTEKNSKKMNIKRLFIPRYFSFEII